MTNIDVRGFPLWKLARCTNISFVEKENNRNNTVKPRPTPRAYNMYLVDDIVNNVPGSTDRLLNEVHHDDDQLALIAKDFHRIIVRRADNLH